MKISLRHFAISCLFLSFLISGCEKATSLAATVKQALDREVVDENAEPPIDPADIPPPPEPVAMEPIVNKDARISILGYHDFTEGHSNNDMILNIDDFRSQMQAIKDADLPVISMREFLDWKQAKANVPAECVMIMIDDGWKATNTLALGVLKEFGYPFTVFLYKNYVGVGGRSMTHEEIRELAANGGTICSHSVSHQNMSQRRGKSDDAYTAWLREELEDSHNFLEQAFGDTGAVLKTFAFPYGIYNDQVLQLAKEFGYEACFTVNGKKTLWDSEDMEIGRYVVHGTTLANFDPALSFGGGNLASSGRKLMTESRNEEGEVEDPLITVKPPSGSIVGNRMPLIEVNLAKLEGVRAETISLRITGFGKVPHTFDADSGIVTYQIPQRLRQEHCAVQVGFRHAGNKDAEIIGWEFKVDLLADYISSEITKPGSNETMDKPTVEPKEEGEETPTASL
jgi:peptidoglycan/xylan/chitin deacetylase (PgdA/CDA1 family)